MQQPIITILMPVYNGDEFLKEAIESILGQSFTDFEFIIINDGSNDLSEEIIKSFSDDRIVYIKNTVNEGIVKTLNKGIEIAKGKYIARMDADDISLPDRILKQYNYLQHHPEVVLCGTHAKIINKKGEAQHFILPETENEAIKVSQLFNNSFVHPSVVFKTEVAKDLRYSLEHQYAEDYFLFTQMSQKYTVGNIDEILLYYRIHDNNISQTKLDQVRVSEKLIVQYQLEYLLPDVDAAVINLHHSFVSNTFLEKYTLLELEKHLNYIKQSNKVSNIYNQDILNKILHEKWFDILLHFNGLRWNYLLLFIKAKSFSFKDVKFKHIRKLIKKSVKK